MHYVMHMKPLGDVTETQGLQHHSHADDTQLYLAFKPKDDIALIEALTHTENCLKNIELWMNQNMLKLKADKTELMLFSSKHNFKSMETILVNMINKTIESIPTVRNLAVMFNCTVSMAQQGNTVCRLGTLNCGKLVRSGATYPLTP